jgi:hypothetical protein
MRQMKNTILAVTALLMAGMLLIPLAPVSAKAEASSEQQVKAAFLFNFAKFVEWPAGAFAGPEDPIVFGVLGDDPVGEAIGGLAGKTVQGRKVAVRRYQSVSEVKVCQVLYISESQSDRAEGIIAALRGAPVLLVADDDDFARRGGMINFVLERNKVGFEINVDAVKRSKLGINAQLIKLARTVY